MLSTEPSVLSSSAIPMCQQTLRLKVKNEKKQCIVFRVVMCPSAKSCEFLVHLLSLLRLCCALGNARLVASVFLFAELCSIQCNNGVLGYKMGPRKSLTSGALRHAGPAIFQLQLLLSCGPVLMHYIR